jgi:hypothetical protein
MRIDVHHHFHGCDCLASEIRELHVILDAIAADVHALMTRDEVPSEVTHALGQVLENVNDNFLPKE